MPTVDRERLTADLSRGILRAREIGDPEEFQRLGQTLLGIVSYDDNPDWREHQESSARDLIARAAVGLDPALADAEETGMMAAFADPANLPTLLPSRPSDPPRAFERRPQ